MEKIERLCIANFIFKIVAAAGAVSIVVLAMMSDSGAIETSEVLVRGSLSFLAASVGVWGSVNCTRMIESYREHLRRSRLRIVKSGYSRAA